MKRERIHEAERYNTSLKNKSDKTLNVLNIHNPSIEVHLAGDKPPNTGAAVIVAPGGGHRILWVGPEGADFARFFKKYGVSTIILRNRLRVDGYNPRTDAVNDAFQAIRLVRAHAAEWKLDPAKIGIMGFSAGAELSAPAALFFEDFERNNSDPADPLAKVSARPNFVGVIYPGPTPFTRDPATRIPRNVPPSFIASAGSGDRVHALCAGNQNWHLGEALRPRQPLPCQLGAPSDQARSRLSSPYGLIEWGGASPAGISVRVVVSILTAAR